MPLRTTSLLLVLSLLALTALPALADLQTDSDWYASVTWEGSRFNVLPAPVRAQTYPANGRSWAQIGFRLSPAPQTGDNFFGLYARAAVAPQPVTDGTQNWVNPKARWDIFDRGAHLLYGEDGTGKQVTLKAGLTVKGAIAGTTVGPGKITFTLVDRSKLSHPDDVWPAAGRTYTLRVTPDGAASGDLRLPKLTYDAKTWVVKQVPDLDHPDIVHYFLHIAIQENGAAVKGDTAGSVDTDSGGWVYEVTDSVDTAPGLGTPTATEGLFPDTGGAYRAFVLTGLADYSGVLSYEVWSTGASAQCLAATSYTDRALAWAYYTKTGPVDETDRTSVVGTLPAVSDPTHEMILPRTVTYWQMRPRFDKEYVSLLHEPQNPTDPRGMRSIEMRQNLTSPYWKTPLDKTGPRISFAAADGMAADTPPDLAGATIWTADSDDSRKCLYTNALQDVAGKEYWGTGGSWTAPVVVP